MAAASTGEGPLLVSCTITLNVGPPCASFYATSVLSASLGTRSSTDEVRDEPRVTSHPSILTVTATARTACSTILTFSSPGRARIPVHLFVFPFPAMLPLGLTVLSLLAAVAPSWQQPQLADPTTIASLYSLTTSTSIPFPTATLSNSDAQSFITSGWSLSKGKIQQGAGNIAFVNDPFPDKPAFTSTDNVTGPVLQVKYPKGAVGSEASGMQLYSLWNTSDGSSFQSMLVSYEVAFDENFDFVKGGKLPGLRGGPDPNGCSGGVAANGTNCFSTRLMWRTAAAGEGASTI